MVVEGLYYTKEHEWLRVEGTTGTVGITDHAQEMLGEVTFVELPAVGQQVAQGKILCAVESSKAASDVYAPAAGTVTEVNQSLETSPELINDSPYDEGWICKLTLSDPSQVESLMNAQQYQDYVNQLEQ